MVSPKQVRLIEFGSDCAFRNMALDRRLLALGEQFPDTAFLRFYTWDPPALSLGHFETADAIDRQRAERDGVEMVRRPTGGRVVLHKDDLTYTVVVPRDRRMTAHELYAEISGSIVDGLAELGIKLETASGLLERQAPGEKPCFLAATRHEIVHAGRKVIGSAQRLGRRAILQHGTIPIGRGYLEVVDYLVCDETERKRLADEMAKRSACLEDIACRKLDPGDVARHLTRAFLALLGGKVASLPAVEAVRLGSGGSRL